MKAKIYTKSGDKGQTSLVAGTRVSKTHPRIEAYGTIDELNSALGMIAAQITSVTTPAPWQIDVVKRLTIIQNNLFNLGSRLACENEGLLSSLPDLHPDLVHELELDMDQWESELAPLKNFILPGGTMHAACSHIARTLCRRAERVIIRAKEQGILVDDLQIVLINRLSDWLFLLARKCNAAAGITDIEWSK